MVGSATILDLGFEPQFWEELDEIFGPILRPILEPIWNAFQDTFFRTYVLSTIIWTCIIVCGMIFLLYEGLPILGFLGDGGQTVVSAPVARRRATSSRRERPEKTKRKQMADRAEQEKKRREAQVREFGVKVTSRFRKKHEQIDLMITVSNESDFNIDMVVIDLDLPLGIDTTIGSFRMQRLGSIITGESKTATFSLQSKGGDIEEIGGHVEFLSASYEISKITLPKPELLQQ